MDYCRNKVSLATVLLAFVCMITSPVYSALTVDNVHISDVTPSSFSVIWQTSESASPYIKIYSDAGGTTEVTKLFEVTPFPVQTGDPSLVAEYDKDQDKAVFRSSLQSKGFVKITVEGIQPAAVYHFNIYSVGATETVVWPETGLSSVTTPVETGFVFESRQLLVSINQADPKGWLIMATTTATDYGVSAYVGDGTQSAAGVLNLANLFVPGGSNWQPDSGEYIVDITILGPDAYSFTQAVTVTFIDNFTVADITAHIVGFDSQATLVMISPASREYVQDEPVVLSWNDTALQVNAAISLYYDVDDSGEDGVLIAEGIEEDPDGVGDTFSWDTSGVSDGRYFIYGVLNDGLQTFLDYAPGAITIDRAGTDNDGDQISDVWELLYFETLDRTGNDDFEDDGNRDREEFGQRTDPTVPDVGMQLLKGMNLVSIPLSYSPSQHASDLLDFFAPSLLSISRINPATQTVEQLDFNDGNHQGTNFEIIPGAGYSFAMAETADKVLSGEITLAGPDLVPGSNLIGFISPREDYTAYQLLQHIGDATVVSSVQRFDRATGLFETVGYHNGIPVGPDFPIIRGEGYIITIR